MLFLSPSVARRRRCPTIHLGNCARRAKMPRNTGHLEGRGASCRERAGRSLRALVERGLVSLVLVREIDDLVVTRREVDVTQHLAAAGALALDMHRKGGPFALSAQNGAESEHRVDVASGDLHARHTGVRAVALAHLVFRIRADERKVVLTEYRRCEHRKPDNAQRCGCTFDHSLKPSRPKTTRAPAL